MSCSEGLVYDAGSFGVGQAFRSAFQKAIRSLGSRIDYATMYLVYYLHVYSIHYQFN
jgi:hypothetical protein